MNHRPHFIVIGGFLGAGKTTAVACLARHLADQGLRAALITNDQGRDLVDTATLRAAGFPTAEIAGGCFCCRFDALLDASRRPCAGEPPDLIVAEAVGSCTDLAATVLRPLRRLHEDWFTIAPLSVLVDPGQARRMLGEDAPAAFSADVRYVFEKQLEEADLIVITKSDLLHPAELEELHRRLSRRFPQAELFAVSARTGSGLGPWFDRMLFGEPAVRPTLEVDYDRYATGEARLGWLNATLRVTGDAPFDPDALLLQLAAGLQQRLRAAPAEVAHLKLVFQPTEMAVPGLAAVNLVRNDGVPEAGRRLGCAVSAGRLLVNVRAEASPETLAEAVTTVLAGAPGGVCAVSEHLEYFRPGRPNPTHRDVRSEVSSTH